MQDMIVKNVDVLGDFVMAAKDEEGFIWVGINYFCQGLEMNKSQRDWQIEKVKDDKTLSKGSRLLPAGIFDASHEMYALRLDFVPIWLAKITITNKMEQEHPELADKLLQYQLKAKDILSKAFLPIQDTTDKDPMELLEMHYKAIRHVNNKADQALSEVSALKQQFQNMESRLPLLPEETAELKERVDGIDAKLQDALLQLPLLPTEAEAVDRELKNRGIYWLGGKTSKAYRKTNLRRRVYWDLHIQVRKEFKVSTYKSIKRCQLDDVVKFLIVCQISSDLKHEIEHENMQIGA